MNESVASLLEPVADALGDEIAVIHGDLRRTWSDLDRRAARLAGALGELGVGRDAKVATYLHNHPAYLETHIAACKARAVPVNVNYRYLADELAYLLDDSDAEVVVFSDRLAPRVEEVRARCSGVRAWLQVGEGSPLPSGAESYEAVVAGHGPAPRLERSGDDLLFLYTGGTTGLPKGVMWRSGDLFGRAVSAVFAAHGRDVPVSPAALGKAAARLRTDGLAPVQLPASPLMHGAAWGNALAALLVGGTVVTLGGEHFDADELWAAVSRHGVTHITIVGDPFARPMIDALGRAAYRGEPYDTSSVTTFTSTGAMFSERNKQALLEHCPGATIVDNLASSEALAMGRRATRAGGDHATARFVAGEHATVLTEDGREVTAGSGEIGMLAVCAPIPVGYYKDPDKTARTFPVIRGTRYAIPGDLARVEADGTIVLLGRGSVCINSGGEKVFPEEVEEAIKVMPAVADCLVVGVADDHFGERVVAVASVRPGHTLTFAEVRERVRGCLAAYKCPRELVIVDTVPRAPNGKPDYAAARALALRDDSVTPGS